MIGKFLKELGSFFEEAFSKEETWWILFISGAAGALVIPLIVPSDLGAVIIDFLKRTWWLWFFIIIFRLFLETWLHWRQEVFKEDINWVLLELKIPRLIEKSSKSMEQVLAALHSLRNSPGNLREIYWGGEVTRWTSLELVSFGGEIHFYVRCYAKLRSLVEAAFFSYYPGLDIIEVPDYISRFPEKIHDMYEKGIDMWGTEMLLNKDAIFPIKTYTDFENDVEEKSFDPISSFLEILGKLRKTESIGIQILIAPASSGEWDEKYDADLKKLREPETRKVKGKQLPTGGNEEYEMAVMRSPGQVDILKAVEENLSKPAFDTLIRLAYFCDKPNFLDNMGRHGIVGAFNQYSALNLNSFRINYGTQTRTQIWSKPYVFPKTILKYRKARLLLDYRKRDVPPEKFMGKLINSFFFSWHTSSERFKMNTKGLATIFHIPTSLVLTEPHLKHLESKRAGPPSGLPIFGEEEELERYK